MEVSKAWSSRLLNCGPGFKMYPFYYVLASRALLLLVCPLSVVGSAKILGKPAAISCRLYDEYCSTLRAAVHSLSSAHIRLEKREGSSEHMEGGDTLFCQSAWFNPKGVSEATNGK